MSLLIITILCSLAASKVIVQGKFSKSLIQNDADTLFFNTGVFLTTAIIFCWKIIGCSPEIIPYSLIIAILTIAFQFFYTKSLTTGNVSVIVLIINLSMIIPTLFSYFFYNESLSLPRIIGIAFTIVALVLCPAQNNKKTSDKKWLILALLASISTSGISVTQKIFNSTYLAPQKEAFLAISYVFAFVFSLILLAIMKTKGTKPTIKLEKRYFISASLIGIILAVHGWLTNYSITVIEGTLLFPFSCGGTILLSTIVGVVLFKDKLTPKQILGVIFGIVAVVLMNF